MVGVNGIDRLNKKLDKLQGGLIDGLHEVMVNGCTGVHNYARDYCPVITGQLRRSINYKIEKMEDRVVGEVGTQGVNYAIYVELGTSKKKARPFLVPAFNDGKSQMKKDLQNKFNQIVRGL